jgi:phosphomannomutase
MINYLFDIDGTLTSPRQKISPEFEEYFFSWMQDRKVYLVTGSDMVKVKEQLSQRIIDACAGVFCSMANEFYIAGKEVYKNELKLPEGFMDWLKDQFNASPYPIKRTNNFEMRAGMLNFSIAGRDSTVEERNIYNNFDNTVKERARIANEINQRYTDVLEACVGGQISIDIQNVGNNKSLASRWIRKECPEEDILFFGDKTMVGGNDRAIVEDILHNMDDYSSYYQVEGPEDLKTILEEI